MVTTVIWVMILIGITLCFFGYRLLRLAMLLGGMVLGGVIGYFIYNLTEDKLPKTEMNIWLIVFVLAGAALFAVLSFKVYRAAIFYVTMLFTSLALLQSYLTVTNSGGLTGFFLALFKGTPLGGTTSVLAEASLPGGNSVGEIVADSVLSVSGGEKNLWIALGVSLLGGVIAAILVCAFQKPAVICMTAAYGSTLITASVFSYLRQQGSPSLEQLPFPNGSAGQESVWEVGFGLIIAAIGIIVQFRTNKKEAKK